MEGQDKQVILDMHYLKVHYFVDLPPLAPLTECLHALLIIPNLLGGTFVNVNHFIVNLCPLGEGGREAVDSTETFQS